MFDFFIITIINDNNKNYLANEWNINVFSVNLFSFSFDCLHYTVHVDGSIIFSSALVHLESPLNPAKKMNVTFS